MSCSVLSKENIFLRQQKAVSLYSWISYTGATTVYCSEWSQYCRGDAAAPVPPDVSQQPVVLGFERLALFFGGLDSFTIFPFALLVEHLKYFITQYSPVSLPGTVHLWACRRKNDQLICFRCILLAACHSISKLSLKQPLHSVPQLVGRRMKTISQAPICPWDELLVVSFSRACE